MIGREPGSSGAGWVRTLLIDLLAGLINLLVELFFVATGRWALKLFGDGEPAYGLSLMMGLVFWALVGVLAYIIQM